MPCVSEPRTAAHRMYTDGRFNELYVKADRGHILIFHHLLSSYRTARQQETVSELTSESPVCSLDSPENHTAASLLNPAACCHSAAALSDGRGWTSELRPDKHS